MACMPALAFLDFDYSEDAEGHGSFDAMAAAAPAQLAALQAEVLGVLGWARRTFGEPQPLDEGGAWDVELQGVREVATTLEVRWAADELELRAGPTGAPRTTLSITLSGTTDFCAAFRAAFPVELAP